MAILRSDTTIGGRNILNELDNITTKVSNLETNAFLKTGGTIIGDVRIKNSSAYGTKLNFGDGDYVYLYEPVDDFLEIKGSKGIALNGTVTSSAPTSLKSNEVKFIYE